ncbi:tetratricopeptide repeat protein [Reinekea sp.]|uniref:tetratricopeptide repeat protein n=1 Tax=Reinekea sp. TaxID=1970455 RepID=UPI002A7EFE35|nr:tetratricopeptide repeat protein [Reinekea sp.]
MSLIHKALRQAEHSSNGAPQNSYNPLSAPQPSANAASSPLVIVGGLLIWAAIAVVAWPVSEPDAPRTETRIETQTAPSQSDGSIVAPVLAAAQVADAPAAAQLIEDAVSTQPRPSEPLAVDSAPAAESDAGATARVNKQINVGLRAIAMAMAPTDNDVELVFEPMPPTIEVMEAIEAIEAIAVTPSPEAKDILASAPAATQRTAPAVKTTQVSLAPLPAPKAIAAPIAVPNAPSVNRSEPALAVATSAVSAEPVEAILPRASIIQDSKNLWQQQVEQAVAVGAIEQAEAILKQWLGAAPNDPVPRVWLARIYIGNGFYRAAEPLLSNPTDSETKALLGLVYERTARPQLAAGLFEELYRVSPENGRWLLFWAINSENSGQLAKSRTLYQTYLTLFGSEDEALTQFSQQRLTTIGAL